ncbi:hypothetical protein S7711_04896 [Stachybotrys chartarum IBT 7711]|uniref:Uncharacterized protein n=1 Tax=Stachybotrys chartarum (strain CBS 109288 / IBT 7711) TaxID=1280523 RepID=A0A084B6G9_STACB|nr:hypothetical protein S7711_04896 [Stachybotrys chartarum IBT 7711]
MSEEPTLPPLPAISWDEQSQSFGNSSRKRARAQIAGGASSTFNSSDPAVFSSDDDPGLDNYVEGRRKKRYIGSWFQQHPASNDSALGECPGPAIGPHPKREFSRQVDSGVFLGSDGAESDVFENVEVPVRTRLQLDRRPQISSTELALRDKIRDYLDHKTDTIDAWSMGLEEISEKTMEMITQSTHFPQVDFKLGPKEPDLKLYLANNLLTRIPTPICDISCITVLSLRANKLKELPPCIAKLRNLRELNVSQNELRYLPSEFLDMMELPFLRLLSLYPNPYIQPEKAPTELFNHGCIYTLIQDPNNPLATLPVPPYMPHYYSRSPFQISTSTGAVLSKFSLNPFGDKLPLEEADSPHSEAPFANLNISTSSKAIAVPSLVELALRSCCRSSELALLAAYLPEELAHLRPLLDRAADKKMSGELACSHCKTMLVVPAFEWIEWDVLYDTKVHVIDHNNKPSTMALLSLQPTITTSTLLPFRYRTCSWRCTQLCREGRDGRAGFRSKQFRQLLHPESVAHLQGAWTR